MQLLLSGEIDERDNDELVPFSGSPLQHGGWRYLDPNTVADATEGLTYAANTTARAANEAMPAKKDRGRKTPPFRATSGWPACVTIYFEAISTEPQGEEVWLREVSHTPLKLSSVDL